MECLEFDSGEFFVDVLRARRGVEKAVNQRDKGSLFVGRWVERVTMNGDATERAFMVNGEG